MEFAIERQRAIRAANLAALSEEERRELARQHAWHCVCYAAAKRMVRTGQYGEEPTLAVVIEDSYALQEEEARNRNGAP